MHDRALLRFLRLQQLHSLGKGDVEDLGDDSNSFGALIDDAGPSLLPVSSPRPFYLPPAPHTGRRELNPGV